MRRPALATLPEGRARALAMMIAMAWRAHRGACCGMLALAALAGLAPIALAWLLRAILDDLAVGPGPRTRSPSRVGADAGGGARGRGRADGGPARLSQYLSAQSGRAVQRHATGALFAVTGWPGSAALEDPAFQDRLRFAQQAGSSGPARSCPAASPSRSPRSPWPASVVTLAVLSPVHDGDRAAAAAIPAIFLERGTAAPARRRCCAGSPTRSAGSSSTPSCCPACPRQGDQAVRPRPVLPRTGCSAS